MRAEANLGPLTLGSNPIVVGTLTDRHFLQSFANQTPHAFCDAVELRVDLLGVQSNWVEEGRRLERIGVPAFATLRLGIEGGKWDHPDNDRIRFLKQAVDELSGIDVELQSRIAPEICSYAHQHHKLCIVSHHDFHQTPPRSELVEIIERAQEIGCVVKVSTMAAAESDIATLASLLETNWQVPLCVIAMGSLGTESRVQFAKLGSCLTYGYLDTPAAPGQLSAHELKQRLSA
jgi:3-dehydroquinate dehydratase-1